MGSLPDHNVNGGSQLTDLLVAIRREIGLALLAQIKGGDKLSLVSE